MAINVSGGGGFSPDSLTSFKPPATSVLPQSLGTLGPGSGLASLISYGGSSGTPMPGAPAMPGATSTPDAQSGLAGMLMLLGLNELAQMGQAGGAQGDLAQLLTIDPTLAADAGSSAMPVPESEKDLSVPITDDSLKGRPPGDNRSADEIIDANPVLKNLGNQKDIKREELKQRFGDWTEANPDPKSRADAAYNMASVLNHIKGLSGRDGSDRGEVANNGKIEGITKDGDARHGSEAGVLKDIAEQGLKMLPDNGKLPQTNDTHVRVDGTNKDNFQWGMGEFGKILSNIPILKSVAAPLFNNIGEARDLGEVFTGGLSGLAEGAMSAARGPVGWGITAVTDTVQIAVENGSKDKKDPPAFS